MLLLLAATMDSQHLTKWGDTRSLNILCINRVSRALVARSRELHRQATVASLWYPHFGFLAYHRHLDDKDPEEERNEPISTSQRPILPRNNSRR